MSPTKGLGAAVSFGFALPGPNALLCFRYNRSVCSLMPAVNGMYYTDNVRDNIFNAQKPWLVLLACEGSPADGSFSERRRKV